jgi:gas vesicle protein
MNLLDLFNGMILGVIIGFLYLLLLNWYNK